MNKPENFVLMGTENPDGWKLEDLLGQLKEEVAHKITKIVDSPNQKISGLVVDNNLKIIEHLAAAQALQESNQVILNTVGPNQGPRGKARI
jgi:hypothetical protein